MLPRSVSRVFSQQTHTPQVWKFKCWSYVCLSVRSLRQIPCLLATVKWGIKKGIVWEEIIRQNFNWHRKWTCMAVCAALIDFLVETHYWRCTLLTFYSQFVQFFIMFYKRLFVICRNHGLKIKILLGIGWFYQKCRAWSQMRAFTQSRRVSGFERSNAGPKAYGGSQLGSICGGNVATCFPWKIMRNISYQC